MKRIFQLLCISSLIFITVVESSIPLNALKDNDSILDIHMFKTILYEGIKTYDLDTHEGVIMYLIDHPDKNFTDVADLVKSAISANSLNLSYRDGELIFLNQYNEPASTYFSSISWIFRSSDGWNLSLVPKTIVRDRFQFAVIGWTAVVNEQSNNSHWGSGGDSLQNQYYCHWIFANTKFDWNLNPSLPNRDFVWDWILNRCN